MDDKIRQDTLKDFVSRTINELLRTLPPEKRLEGLSPEERLEGLSAEDVLKALTPEMREALARQLKPNGAASEPGRGPDHG